MFHVKHCYYKRSRQAGSFVWWTVAESNRWPLQCECSALPAELTAQESKRLKLLGTYWLLSDYVDWGKILTLSQSFTWNTCLKLIIPCQSTRFNVSRETLNGKYDSCCDVNLGMFHVKHYPTKIHVNHHRGVLQNVSRETNDDHLLHLVPPRGIEPRSRA